MIKRALQLPLWAAMIVILALSGCGKRIPTAVESRQGYPRSVLVELFTSKNCPNCPIADAAAERIVSEMGDSLCLIEFHPKALPTFGDTIGTYWADTLANHYWVGMAGAGNLPLFICDGSDKYIGIVTDAEGTYQNYRQMIDVRKQQKSPLQINLTAQLDQGGIRYSADINTDESLQSSLNLGLVLVVVEDSVTAYGEQYRYVARKLYPNTEGDPLVLSASSSITKTGLLTRDLGWLQYRLTLVAYVRNNDTKEIVQSAKVRIIAATTAPAVPSLSLPASGATGISLSPTLSWNASGGAASYTLQYDTDSLFTGGNSQSGLTGTSFKISGLANSATYYWRVNASNNAGISEWSPVRHFTTTSTAIPAQPTLAWPSDGETGVSKSPTLTWNTRTGASSYGLQVAMANSFSPSSMVLSQTGLTGTSQGLLGLKPSTTYYWRVNAANIAGSSAWSDVWSFITTANPAPESPMLVSPDSGLTTAATGTGLALKWGASYGATGYGLQISPFIDFRYQRYNQSGLTDTGFVAGGLDSLTTYYWRVNASDTNGTSGWSQAWSFTDARSYSFSRVIVPDTLTWVPDTLITFILQDTLTHRDIPGFNLYFTNLTAGRITLWNHAPRDLCSDTVLMAGGQLCNSFTCGMNGGSLSDRINGYGTQYWTVHAPFAVTYPPAGKYSFTLLSWSSDYPSHIMSRKLYLEVLP